MESSQIALYRQNVAETAGYLGDRLKNRPQIGILTGTGLAESAGSIDVRYAAPYETIPHFPVSTVQSHAGRLVAGTLAGKPVLALQGRFHLYEGYSAREVTFAIRVMQQLGVKVLILTNAAGGLNPDFEAGDLMLITDHINLTGTNPLAGPNVDHWGIRFPDMTAAYDPHLSRVAKKAAADTGTGLKTGVYAGLKGPSLETPAETRFLKTIGADAVGFSTVQEVIAAVHGGIQVLGLSTITNINNPDAPEPARVEEIIATANAAAPRIDALIQRVVAAL